MAEIVLGWQMCMLLEVSASLGQHRVPDLIVIEEGERNHLVDLNEFPCRGLRTIKAQAVLIAILDWIGAVLSMRAWPLERVFDHQANTHKVKTRWRA